MTGSRRRRWTSSKITISDRCDPSPGPGIGHGRVESPPIRIVERPTIVDRLVTSIVDEPTIVDMPAMVDSPAIVHRPALVKRSTIVQGPAIIGRSAYRVRPVR